MTVVNNKQLFDKYCQERDLETRNKLLEKYSFIAEIAAKKFVGKGVDYDDLKQVASLALIKALDRFDCSKGVQFGSFATPSIIGEIKNYFRDKTHIVRIPRRDNEFIKKIDNAKLELLGELGRYPKPDELAERIGITTERLYELEEARAATQAVSLDSHYNNGTNDDMSLAELIGEDEADYIQIENRDFLNKCMKNLTTKEVNLLKDRFIFNKSQSQIAQGMGVSQMYVSRMEKILIEKLRKML